MRRSTLALGCVLGLSLLLNAVSVFRKTRRDDRGDRKRSVPFSKVEPAREEALQRQVRQLEDELAALRAKTTPPSSVRADPAAPFSEPDDAVIAARVRGRAAFVKLKRDSYDYQNRSEVTPEPVFVNDLMRLVGEFLGLRPDRLPAMTSAIQELAEALDRATHDYQAEAAPLKAMPDSDAKKRAEKEAGERFWERHEQALRGLDGIIGTGDRAKALRKWAPTLAGVLRHKLEGDRTGQYVYFSEIDTDWNEDWP